MTIDGSLQEIERITHAMLECARQEQWQQLAGLEEQQRALVRGFDTRLLNSASQQATLQRVVEVNATITQRLRDHKNDIGLLLRAFDDPAAKAAE